MDCSGLKGFLDCFEHRPPDGHEFDFLSGSQEFKVKHFGVSYYEDTIHVECDYSYRYPKLASDTGWIKGDIRLTFDNWVLTGHLENFEWDSNNPTARFFKRYFNEIDFGVRKVVEIALRTRLTPFQIDVGQQVIEMSNGLVSANDLAAIEPNLRFESDGTLVFEIQQSQVKDRIAPELKDFLESGDWLLLIPFEPGECERRIVIHANEDRLNEKEGEMFAAELISSTDDLAVSSSEYDRQVRILDPDSDDSNPDTEKCAYETSTEIGPDTNEPKPIGVSYFADTEIPPRTTESETDGQLDQATSVAGGETGDGDSLAGGGYGAGFGRGEGVSDTGAVAIVIPQTPQVMVPRVSRGFWALT